MIGAMVKAAVGGYVENLRCSAIRVYRSQGQSLAPDSPLMLAVESAFLRDNFTRYLRRFDPHDIIGKGCSENCILSQYLKDAVPGLAEVSVDYTAVTFLARECGAAPQYQFRLPFWASTLSHLNDEGHWVTARRVRNWNMIIPGYRCVPYDAAQIDKAQPSPLAQPVSQDAPQAVPGVGPNVITVVFAPPAPPASVGLVQPGPMKVLVETDPRPPAPSFVPNYKEIEELYASAEAPFVD